jgi:hypothetical protein
MLSAEELLAGSALTYDVTVPADLLAGGSSVAVPTVRLRPLTIADLQTITRAAKDSDALVATLMVQRALVEPVMSVVQVAGMSAGLLEHLLGEVMRISGMSLPEPELHAAVEAPLAKAAHMLAREFGWTPPQVSELTLGQILVHLQMLEQEARA